MPAEETVDYEDHEITNPVAECQKWQKRYNRCVKKFANGYVKGEARSEKREDCLERFDDFQKCVLDAARKMQEQHKSSRARTSWW